MSQFNELIRWSNLARLAGGRTAKLTIAAPFAAFIILHNEPLQPVLRMSESWHPNPLIESLALARFDIFYLGLVVIGIAVDFPDQVAAYAEEAEFNYPILVGQEDAMAVAETSGVEFIGMPFTMIVAADGELISTHIGEIIDSHLEHIVRVLTMLDNGEIDKASARKALAFL